MRKHQGQAKTGEHRGVNSNNGAKNAEKWQKAEQNVLKSRYNHDNGTKNAQKSIQSKIRNNGVRKK